MIPGLTDVDVAKWLTAMDTNGDRKITLGEMAAHRQAKTHYAMMAAATVAAETEAAAKKAAKKSLRMYSAQDQSMVQKAVVAAQKDGSQSWALPIFGICAMFTLVAGVGFAQVRRNARRTTRQVTLLPTFDIDEENASAPVAHEGAASLFPSFDVDGDDESTSLVLE